MRGLTAHLERYALEMRGAVPFDVGQGLLERGLVRLIESDDDLNHFDVTGDGKRALRLDWLARIPR